MKTDKTIKYLFAVILYGTIGYFLHYVNVASEFVVMCRGLIGSLFILLVMFINKDLPDLKAIRNNLFYLAISGIALGLNWVFLFCGYKYSISISSLCNYTAPIMVVIISSIFLKEKITPKQIVCIVCSFIGILLISGIFDNNETNNMHGFIYGLLAAIGFVVLVLFNRKLKNIKPLDKTVVQLFFSFITVLPYVLINKSIPTSLDRDSILIIILLGILHTGVAYIFYFGSIDTLPVSKVAILGYIEPVLSIITGVVFFKEQLSVLGGIGALLILTSAFISETSRKS